MANPYRAMSPNKSLFVVVGNQGISHKCRYSLGSMAAWTHLPDVHLLTPSSPLEVSALSPLTYFKIYVPEDVWVLEVSILGCVAPPDPMANASIMDDGACLSGFGMRAVALPFPQPINISSASHGEFVQVELQPQTNVYHYIGVVTAPPSRPATYTITVNFQGNPSNN
ncbi:TMEM8A [Cordylochernes scorpioides]|uniref:TMEM8A n=1 Tax=Cordylochernes scorpioides TaxID=51811 RepID=A0ABY6JZU0_9ARAC|nr:TMEM8A [Cordylochernes scorpioides]